MTKIQIGIDPGKQGAISYFIDGKFKEIIPIPLIKNVIDPLWLGELLNPVIIRNSNNLLINKDVEIHYYMEESKVNWMGGKKQIAEARGLQELIRGILIGYKVKYTTFKPEIWQKYCWIGITPVKNSKGKNDTKTTSFLALQRLYPELVNLVKTKTKQGFDDGLVDAILIGHYGIKNY